MPSLALTADTTVVTPLSANEWTVQIGAFGNATLAQSELAAYAQRSSDLLGEAARIVSPLSSREGHVIYRARFGLFAQDRARQVCQALTRRGQDCFAVIASK